MAHRLIPGGEGSRSVGNETISYEDPDTLHVVVGNNHFVPILPQSKPTTEKKGKQNENAEHLSQRKAKQTEVSPQIMPKSQSENASEDCNVSLLKRGHLPEDPLKKSNSEVPNMK